MHIFLISQYFPPEKGAACSRWGDYVDLLIEKGHKVTVLCEAPNYPYGVLFDGYSYKWSVKEKVSNSLTIIRSGVWANNRKTTLKLLGHYLSFVFTGIFNSLKVKNCDLIIVSSPPLFVGIIAILLKKIKGFKILLDIRDIWPESVIALSDLKSNFFIKSGKWLESKIYNSVDGFIFPVPGFSNYIKKNFPQHSDKPMFNLMNGINKEFLNVSSSKQPKIKKGVFTVLYSGNIGRAQGLEVVIDTALKLIDYPINFRFIGEGVKKQDLIHLAKLKDLKNILFNNILPREKLISEIRSANVCLVPLLNKKLFKVAIPSKIFEIMACGKPIILGVKGEAEQIIKKNNCGIIVKPEDSDELAKAILYYYNNINIAEQHGINGVSFVTKKMQKKLLISNFLNDLKSYY